MVHVAGLAGWSLNDGSSETSVVVVVAVVFVFVAGVACGSSHYWRTQKRSMH